MLHGKRHDIHCSKLPPDATSYIIRVQFLDSAEFLLFSDLWLKELP